MLCPTCGRPTDEERASLCVNCSAKLIAVQPTQEESLPEQAEYSEEIHLETANVPYRICAYLIDSSLSAITIYTVVFLVNATFSDSVFDFILKNFNSSQSNTLAKFSLASLLGFAFVPILETVFGGTPGKLLIGLKVVRQSGENIGYGIAIVRHLIRLVTVLLLFVGFALALFTEKKQACHDYLTDTIVVRKWNLNGFVVLIVTVVLFLINTLADKKFSRDFETYYVRRQIEIKEKNFAIKEQELEQKIEQHISEKQDEILLSEHDKILQQIERSK